MANSHENSQILKNLYAKKASGESLNEGLLEILTRKGIDIPAELWPRYESTKPSLDALIKQLKNEGIDSESPLAVLLKQKWEDKKPYIQPHDILPPNLPIWKGNLKGGAYTEGSRPSYPDTVHYNQNLEGIKAIEAIFYNMKYGKDLDLDKFFEREKQIQEEKYIKNEE